MRRRKVKYKIKYNIGDDLYYFDRGEKKIKPFTVREILIIGRCDDGVCYKSFDAEGRERLYNQKYVRRTPEKLVKEVLGINYVLTDLLDKLVVNDIDTL